MSCAVWFWMFSCTLRVGDAKMVLLLLTCVVRCCSCCRLLVGRLVPGDILYCHGNLVCCVSVWCDCSCSHHGVLLELVVLPEFPFVAEVAVHLSRFVCISVLRCLMCGRINVLWFGAMGADWVGAVHSL